MLIILQQWKLILIAALSALVLLQGLNIDSLNTKLSNTEYRLTESQANIKQLMNNIDEQNKAVNEFKNASTKNLEAHKELLQQASSKSKNYAKTAEKIMATTGSTTSTSDSNITCNNKEINELINTLLK